MALPQRDYTAGDSATLAQVSETAMRRSPVGLPVRRNDLRHTFASLLIAGGANITFVSRQLGHTSSQITLSVYAHLLDREEQARRTREMLQEMLGRRRLKSGTNKPRETCTRVRTRRSLR